MATLTTNIKLSDNAEQGLQHSSLWDKWIAIADAQAYRKTFWFMFSLISQGVLFLPLPAFLIYYFNASVVTLGITLILFFANFIAGMGGSNIRVTLTLFVVSALVHLTMLLAFVL